MKLSFSNIGWTKEQDDNACRILKKYGFSGIEIAPTRLVEENPYDHIGSAVEFKEQIKRRYDLDISSMQSIWYGRNESIFGTDSERRILFDYTKKVILYAEAMHIHNIVFGCPRNRNINDSSDLKNGLLFFRSIGEFALNHNTVIAMEANPVIYDTNYVNFTKDAFELVKSVDSKGFKVNLDIGTMIYNKESLAILKGLVSKINHVHISEPNLNKIERRTIHNEIISILKNEGYNRWISVEMRNIGDIAAIEDVCEYVVELDLEG